MGSDEATVLNFAAAQLGLPLGPSFEQLEFDLPGVVAAPLGPDSNCLFCKHADSEANTVVMRKGDVYARLDNFPASPGHIEIVPFRHVQSFFEMTSNENRDLFGLAKKVRGYLDRLYNPDGYTIGINDGSAAGRTVPHLHLHIIPRWYGDVEDPRGGIRQIFPDCNVETWLK